MNFFKKKIISLINLIGYEVIKINLDTYIPKDFDIDSLEIYQKVKDLTLLPPERILSLIQSVQYVEDNNIEGDYVECGVYMGGGVLTIALTLEKLYPNSQKKIWLYDTFSGMPLPSKHDVKHWFETKNNSFHKTKALNKISRYNISNDSSDWANCSLDKVQNNIFSNTVYNSNNFKFIKGKVEDTIPRHSPNKIALLRLDTDFYESTKHELIYLYPNLEINGVLIIDDYGLWEGSKKAVDEYFSERKTKIFLSRIDYACRSAIKIS
jgi:O-methyltransferase